MVYAKKSCVLRKTLTRGVVVLRIVFVCGLIHKVIDTTRGWESPEFVEVDGEFLAVSPRFLTRSRWLTFRRDEPVRYRRWRYAGRALTELQARMVYGKTS